MNVAGQTLVPTIVAKCEGLLDQGLFNAERGTDAYAEESIAQDAAEAARSPGDAAGLQEPSLRQPAAT